MTRRPRIIAVTIAALALLALALPLGGARGAPAAPAFVQQVSTHATSVAGVALSPTASTTLGNRLIVLVGVWSGAGATAASVTDSAANKYVELLHFKASDGTEMSVWTAPITAGGGTRPTVTVKPSSTADVGAAVSEYSGLSTVADATVVDQMAHASGTTAGAATVASGATPATTAGNELAVGFYVDSGFGDTLTAGSGWTQRTNVSNTSDMEFVTEDQYLASAGANPSAAFGTGSNTFWLTAAVVFKAVSSGGSPTAPGAPSGVTATAGDKSATVSWTAPSDGGSPITTYTITPYVGTTAQTPTTITGSPPATSATVNGLTNGTAYTFTVTATNAVGTGPSSAPSGSVTPTAGGGGQWGPLLNWPIVAIHSALMKNGNVLQFDGWQQPQPTDVWNPSTQAFTTQTAPDGIFCSGMAELPDGRVIIIGGWGGLSTGQQGIVDTSVFDPATSTWSRAADMHSPRWYPDLTELADGRFVAISGNSTTTSLWADTPEVYDPATNTWTLLSNVSTSQVHEFEYPFSYLLPSGKVFTIGPSVDKSFLLDVPNQTWTQVGGPSGVVNGSSVMYRPGKILYSGGAPNVITQTNSAATTAVIDLTAATPQWQQTQPMAYARTFHTMTMLPDGTVLAVGGEPTSGDNTGQTEVSGGVLPTEIWNPTTQTWSTVASTGVTRGYHSTAVLLPDATVLVAGSGHAEPNQTGQYSAQVYSPPYLFKGARPVISAAPKSTTNGSTISVSTPDAASIASVNLVSLGANTHQTDGDQHFVPLTFSAGSGSLNVQIPASGAVVPPSNYMLFVVNSSGVPSVASMLSVSPPPTSPMAPTAVNAVAGNASATVTWTAPPDGGSPITSYTVTPYVGSTAQTSTTVTGTPPATSATIGGLSNGTSYTFTVTATNAVGAGAASAPSNAVTPGVAPAPAYVQQVSAHSGNVASQAVTLPSNVKAGDRLVVETGVWNSAGATMGTVTDSAGNTYTELLHYMASDGTEMSVWSAPVTAGGGTRPTVTVKPTSSADVGVAVLEYAGLSAVADATIVDQQAHAAGTTGAAATVASGATAATTAANELALGFYVDSGFGDALKAGSGFTQRVNISNTGDMELVVEDQAAAAAGAQPNGTVGTGASTTWLMATLVLKAPAGGHAADIARATHRTRGHRVAVAQRSRRRAVARHRRPAGHIHRGARHPVFSARTHCNLGGHAGPVHARACASLARAAAISTAARSRFVYLALLQHLSASLLCRHGSAGPIRGAWIGGWL
jgi:hypothetical protein